MSCDDALDRDAKLLYGLLHARFIIETRGMLRMVPKFSKKDFGHCPRSYCQEHPVLPMVSLSSSIQFVQAYD